jgi:hypothetical protein
MLSSALYTNKELAVCYELGANCHDANPTEPFIITMPTTLESSIRFRDFGPGLSHADVCRLLTVYGASDKADILPINGYSPIGGYGIGAKSPAAVTDSWTVSSYHGGKCVEFLVFINEHGIPSLTKIRETPSDETGLEVCIPVAKNRWETWGKCVQDAFKYYTIKPVVKNLEVKYPEDIIVSTGSTWRIRKYNSRTYHNSSMFITTCRGYSPDTMKLGQEFTDDPSLIDVLRIPIFIDFDTNDLQLSLSRESIQYTKSSVQNIRKKLTQVKAELFAQIESILSSANDGLEFRQKIYEAEQKIFGSKGLQDAYINKLIFGAVAGRHNIFRPEDVKEFSVKVSDADLLDLRGKVSNGIRSQRLERTSCFKTYCIKLTDSHSGQSQTQKNIRLLISAMDSIKIVVNDVRGGDARVNFNFENLGCMFALIVNKNIFPKELQKYVIKASSLAPVPKKPREKRLGVAVAKTKSNIFRIRRNSFVRTDEASEKMSRNQTVRFSYVTFTSANSTYSIKNLKWQETKSILEKYNWVVVGIKEGSAIPAGYKSIEEATVILFNESHNLDYIQLVSAKFACSEIYGKQYSGEVGSFVAGKKFLTKNASVWNELQAEYQTLLHLVTLSKAYDLTFYDYERLAHALGVTPLAMDKSFLDKLSASLYATYPMLRFVRDIYAADFEVVKNYLELVGK